jgi:hypothetical protein
MFKRLRLVEIEGVEGPYKKFRVMGEGNPTAVFGSFDSLEAAIFFAKTLGLDRRHYVHDGNEIVWPPDFSPIW